MTDTKNTMDNINPNVYKRSADRPITAEELDENIVDPIDQREVFGKLTSFSYKVVKRPQV